MADQVIALMQEMRSVEDDLALVVLHKVADEIAAADADEVVPRIKGAEYARLVAATFDVGIEIKLDRFFQPAQNGGSSRSPFALLRRDIDLPFVSVADVFVQLQPALRQELAQDASDERIGADDMLAVVGLITQLGKHLLGAAVRLHGCPGEDMRIFLAADARSGVMHAGDILLADVAAHRVQVFKAQPLCRNVNPVHGRVNTVGELSPGLVIADFGHDLHRECVDCCLVSLYPRSATSTQTPPKYRGWANRHVESKTWRLPSLIGNSTSRTPSRCAVSVTTYNRGWHQATLG